MICDFDQALVQLINFEKKKQRTMAWNSTLEYGTKMKMHISAYIQVHSGKLSRHTHTHTQI